MTSFTSITTAAFVSITLAVPATAETFTGFLGFGDSLSDKGRFGQLQPPSLEGRFSDGRTWMEVVGAEFEERGLANINLALGGATAGPENNNDPNFQFVDSLTPRDPNNPDDIPLFDLRNFDAQISAFVDAGFEGALGDNPLISVFLGGNDFLQGGAAADPFAVVGSIAAGITRLASLGDAFDNFIVATQPDLAIGPNSIGLPDAVRAQLTEATLGYNFLLTTALADVAVATGVEIEFIDTFGIFNGIFDEAVSAGLITDRACTDSLSRPTPDPLNACFVPGSSSAFLFVDSVHPSSFAHERLGAAVTAQIAARLPPAPVPLPAGLPLMVLSRAGLAALRKLH